MTSSVRKLLITGLSGAGKTTLALELVKRLGAVHLNGDEVRRDLNRDLGFSVADRVEQARRMGVMADLIVRSGGWVVSDFICPTPETREAFGRGGQYRTIFVDRIAAGRFADTNALYVPPVNPEWRVGPEGSAAYWAALIAKELVPVFNPEAPTALFLGRYQPFHAGHRALIEEGINRVGQAVIAVRSLPVGPSNPHSFAEVEASIRVGMRGLEGKFHVVQVPNVTHVLYGRDVGYAIERIDLPTALQAVRATSVRQAESDGPKGAVS